ncbi:MAG: aminotransferase class I/II-fold pyridoxal phosphate-dependent enzyme [Acidimicrobiales bacterium]
MTVEPRLVASVPPPRRHGGDGAAVAVALGLDPAAVLDLSASMNPVAPDIARLLLRHVEAVKQYPDPAAATAALAEAIGVDVASVLVTNGGAEAIALVAAELGGRVVEPEFSLHPRGTGPLWRSNPHNPSGRLAAPSEQADVWDEAFYPLATGQWTRGDGAVVVGSLTKLFACPGLRLGYVLAAPDLVGRLRRRQPEWSVNGLAAAVLPELLDNAPLPKWARAVAERREALSALLGAHGLDPGPSDANYVLCRRASGLRERLARFGIVVRDCASFGLVDHARVAVPDWDGIERLGAALETSGP